MIPVLKPSMTEREVEAVADVLRSGWLGNGPVCQRFEAALAKRYGYEHCVTVNSATAALHLACVVNGIGPGDEVIVPALTFVSTALAVSYCGARPIFADVVHDTLTLDWCEEANLHTNLTKMTIPVDFAGYPAAEHQRIIPRTIQDAAHSAGGMAYGDMICLSFHPVKPLATGDGGAILLNDAAKADRLRALRWCGIDRSTWERNGKRYAWDYDIAEIGYKCHWNDIQAAIALVQLDRLDTMQARRRQIAETYTRELAHMVQTPRDHPLHTWHLYCIRIDSERRNALIDHLAKRGISAGVHYQPLTCYPMYADQPTPPVTEREWQRMVSLPIFADLTEAQQEWVIDAVKEFCR